MKRRRVVLCLVVFALCSAAGCAASLLYKEGQRRNENVLRYARMIDTSADHYRHKGNEYFNTYGYFVDRETGLHFTDDINDSLYRQFERGGNKGIEVSWHYSVDKREQTSIGFFYIMLAQLIYLVIGIVTLVLVVRLLIHCKGKLK